MMVLRVHIISHTHTDTHRHPRTTNTPPQCPIRDMSWRAALSNTALQPAAAAAHTAHLHHILGQRLCVGAKRRLHLLQGGLEVGHGHLFVCRRRRRRRCRCRWWWWCLLRARHMLTTHDTRHAAANSQTASAHSCNAAPSCIPKHAHTHACRAHPALPPPKTQTGHQAGAP